MRPEMNLRASFDIPAKAVNPQAGDLQPAMSAFMIKGFTRSFAAMAVMLANWEVAELREAGLVS